MRRRVAGFYSAVDIFSQALSRAVDYIRSQGILIPDELISQVAPLPWAHIALTGDYLWNEIDRRLESFRPIRADRFNPNNFKFP